MGSRRRARLFTVPLAALVLAAPSLGPSSGQATVRSGLDFEIVPTVFFIDGNGGLKQKLDVVVNNPGPEVQADLKVRIGPSEETFPLGLLTPGTTVNPIYLPDVKDPVPVRFRLVAGRTILEKDVTLLPQRKWTVHLFHHSHTDIGYTELQTRVARKHAEYLDSVIEYCKATEDYPDEAKFRWNIEIAWAFENYVKARPADKVRELVALIKEGRVEPGAWYVQLSDAFAHEELIRAVARTRELGREYGFGTTCAMNNDVTGFSWAAPQILLQAGVPYFATGINETRARAPLKRPGAFYWESPDGSRVLLWNGEHYLFANTGLLIHQGAERSAARVGNYLDELGKRGDYPYDILALNIGSRVTDNAPPGLELSDRVREWNRRWAWPKLRLSTMSSFFRELEQRYAPSIPVHRMGWPDYWTDGVASTAYETGLNRLSHNGILTAEKLAASVAALDAGSAYPGEEIREAYRDMMLFDEHTWGAHNSIAQPGSELARGQWALKSAFAYSAHEAAGTLVSRGMMALAGQLASGDTAGIAVFNPLSWPRTGVVRIDMPGWLRDLKGRFRLVDSRSGTDVSFQLLDGREMLFTARDVPSLGYARFGIDDGDPPPQAPLARFDEAGRSIENAFFKVVIDPVSGGVASVIDKELGVELVDKRSAYALNTYIHELPEGGRKAVDDMEKPARFSREVPRAAGVSEGISGPVATSAIVRSAARMCPALEQEIVLYDDMKRIDFINRLEKTETYEPEAVYFAFPFALEGAAFRIELADADMAPETEQLPRTTRDWQAVQHWVEIANGRTRVVWSPIEAPLVQLGGINTGKWLTRLDPSVPSIFSYAMNNYWMTNFRAAQGGGVTLRYSLTSGAGGADRVASSRFGWEVHTPLEAAWVPEKNAGPLGSAEASFFAVDRPEVIIQAVKRAEDGSGIVLRLREIAGRGARIRLVSPFLKPGLGAVETGLVEEERAPLEVRGDAVLVDMKPFEIRTVKMKGRP